MLSLTVLMLCFQNCTSGEGLGSSDNESLSVPATIFAAKAQDCSQASTTFKVSETVYICAQNIGLPLKYCHSFDGLNCVSQQSILAATGWGLVGGNWVKAFPATSSFGVSSITAYAIEINNPSSFGQTSFTVSP